MALTRGDAMRLDNADPLADFRERFVIADEHRLYLDGNSLGRLPKRTRERLHAVIDQWGEDLVSGWPDWIEAPTRTGDALAAVLGASPGEVLVADSTTVNLFKLVNAVLDADPSLRSLVTDADNFPTDRYVLEGIARARGLELQIFESADPLHGPQPGDLPRDGLIVLSHVGYRSGALADMATLDTLGTVIWDLSHSAGAVPIELNAIGVRYAVGCTYKYLNSGPGGAAYLYVAEAEQERLQTPIQGWFGQDDQFAMERPYAPAAGICALPRRHAADPRPGGGRGGRADHRRGGDGGAAREVDRAERADDRAARRVADAAGLHARVAARSFSSRLARVVEPPGGVADLPRADRARGRRPRLPRPGQRAAGHRAALHALRRRLGRHGSPARAGRARRAARRGSDALARHLEPAIASSVRRCISSSDMSSVCVASIQRWPYGSFSEPARSPWNWSDGRLSSVAPALSARS